MNKQFLYGTLAVSTGLAVIALAGPTLAASFQNNGRHDDARFHQQQQMKDVLDAADYNAWSELMANNPRADEIVNEDTFNKLVQAHNLMQSGDQVGAKAIFDELGMGGRFGNRPFSRGSNGQAMKDALENDDYQAWSELMANHPNATDLINQETFTKMIEAHNLIESGRAILEELGVGPKHKGPGHALNKNANN